VAEALLCSKRGSVAGLSGATFEMYKLLLDDDVALDLLTGAVSRLARVSTDKAAEALAMSRLTPGLTASNKAGGEAPRGIRDLGAEVWRGDKPPAERGFVALGVPIGHEDFNRAGGGALSGKGRVLAKTGSTARPPVCLPVTVVLCRATRPAPFAQCLASAHHRLCASP
ncbi:ccdc135, partial [Symbiodinium pilosum]